MKASYILSSLLLFGIVFGFWSCAPVNSQEKSQEPPTSSDFKAYWYAGKGELTRFELSQARYGEMHKGDAVLIFVTEDFRTDKQVKYEGGSRENVQSVLKLNFTKKFFTGLYPYSLMTSIFSPVDYTQPTLKAASSSQEWCGHTYSQLNWRNKKYEGKLFSYFQAEGDREFTLDDAMLEDEIWTKIRLNPDALPIGNIKLIPGMQFLRLKHRDFEIAKATASLETTQDASLSEKPLRKYRIEYKDFNRVLAITFEASFPYTIVAWEEQSPSVFGNPQSLTTRAVRTHTLHSDYWSKHDVADAALRKELGLDPANY